MPTAKKNSPKRSSPRLTASHAANAKAMFNVWNNHRVPHNTLYRLGVLYAIVKQLENYRRTHRPAGGKPAHLKSVPNWFTRNKVNAFKRNILPFFNSARNHPRTITYLSNSELYNAARLAGLRTKLIK